VAANLIKRLYQPRLFLEDIAGRINEGGILLLTSTYGWSESIAAKEFWLGGYEDANGKEVYTIETLKEILEQHFELLHTQDVEFMMPKSTRDFRHAIAEASVWQKR